MQGHREVLEAVLSILCSQTNTNGSALGLHLSEFCSIPNNENNFNCIQEKKKAWLYSLLQRWIWSVSKPMNILMKWWFAWSCAERTTHFIYTALCKHSEHLLVSLLFMPMTSLLYWNLTGHSFLLETETEPLLKHVTFPILLVEGQAISPQMGASYVSIYITLYLKESLRHNQAMCASILVRILEWILVLKVMGLSQCEFVDIFVSAIS